MKKDFFWNRRFSNIFLKIFPNFFSKYFCSFELARQFSMFTDFVINFDLKNDWVIAVWKFWFWISSQHKMWRGSIHAPYIFISFIYYINVTPWQFVKNVEYCNLSLSHSCHIFVTYSKWKIIFDSLNFIQTWAM